MLSLFKLFTHYLYEITQYYILSNDEGLVQEI